MSRKRQEQRREAERQRQQREQQQAAIKHKEQAKQQAKQLRDAANKFMIDITHEPAPAPPVGPPPVFSECVIGFRHWWLDPVGQLRAITMTKQIWRPGINVARCRPRDHGHGFLWAPFATADSEESHPAPAEHCHCGLYGWNDFPEKINGHGEIDASGQLPVLGAIAAWGDLRVHHEGFRASHACVVALAYDEVTTARVHDTLRRVGAEYRVPVVHVETLQAEAERHGAPLPPDVRPPQSEWWGHPYVVGSTPPPQI